MSPLTAPEAVEYGKMYASGDTAAQRRVVMSLAAFGYAGGAEAARQIAPGEVGLALQGLVGLASVQNRAVGATRVAQVLSGHQIIKNEKSLINDDDADRQFRQYVGGALFFYPAAVGGFLANAKALLAFEANQRGNHEWADAQGSRGQRMYAAVNSALGAYTKDGKQYGALRRSTGRQQFCPTT